MTSFKKHIIVTCICLIHFGIIAHGQFLDDINISSAVNATITTEHFTNKALPTATITASGGGPATVIAWEVCIGSSSETCSVVGWETLNSSARVAASNLSGQEIVLTPNGSQVDISYPSGSTSPVDTGTFIFRLRATDSNNTSISRSRGYKLVVRPPLKMTFVVDRSGSMECIPDSPISTNDWAACADPNNDNNKFNLVRDGIAAFLTPLVDRDNTQVPGDVFRIIYFDGDTIQMPSGSLANSFSTISDFQSGIVADFNLAANQAGTGRNGTGLGQALKINDSDYQQHLDGNFRQIVVVITDGQENRPLKVLDTGLGLTDGKTLHNNETNTSHVEYYVIGMDGVMAAQMHNEKLQKLSTGGSSNTHFIDPGLVPDVSGAINHLITSVYANHSPQIVASYDAQLNHSPLVFDFPVNRYVQNIDFSVSFRNTLAENFLYRILRDSIDYTEHLIGQEPRFFGNTAMLMMDVDRLIEDEDSVQGNWSLIVTPTVTDNVEVIFDDVNILSTHGVLLGQKPNMTATCTVEEPLIDINYDLGQSRFQVGDNIQPRVKVFAQNRPITNASVSVEVIKPGADKGHLISGIDAGHEVKSGSEINNPFSVKYANILQDNPTALAPLQALSNVINLTENQPGVYGGSYNNLDVSDNYTLFIRVEADDPYLGKIVRYKRISISVRFDELDHTLVKQHVSTNETADGFYHTLTYTPAYEVNGNVQKVGPGFTDGFRLEAPEGTTLTDVTDNGDGSYTLKVFSDQENPKTTFYLLDEPFYEDRPIQEFDGTTGPTDSKLHLSLHAGITQPFQMLDSLYNGGVFAEIDFGFDLSRKLDLELIGGYYRFESDFSIVGGSANLRYDFTAPGNATGATLAAGVGMYKPSSTGVDFGINARIGVQRQIQPNLSLSIEGAYFIMPTPDYQWGTLGAALRLGF